MPEIHLRAASIWREVARRNLDQAFIVDVDLGAGRRDDFADDLAAGADDVADLRLVDLHRFDTRGECADSSLAGFTQCLGHFSQGYARGLPSPDSMQLRRFHG